MQVYLSSISMGLVTFVIVAILLTIPFSIFQYRKYGYINKWRTLIIFSFILYCLCAYYLVIWPLPSTRDVQSLQTEATQHLQLVPFTFIRQLIEGPYYSDGLGLIKDIFLSRVFLQAFFNILLLVPMGFFLKYLFNRTWYQVLIISFLISLFFELTQLSGLYGYYNAPYRIFDVDDLFLNTLGGLLGVGFYHLVQTVLPDWKKLDRNLDLNEKPISGFRRILAYMIDTFLFSIVVGFIVGNTSTIEGELLIALCYAFVLYLTNGKSFGLWLTRLRVVEVDQKKLTLKAALIRCGIFFLYAIPTYLLQMLYDMERTTLIAAVVSVLRLVYLGLLLFYFVGMYLLRKKYLHEKLSKTKTIIS